MADKNTIAKALKELEATMASAMLAPYDANLDKIEKELGKERSVNPMAIRPPGTHVTLTEEKPVVNVIKKLFGF